MLPFFKFNVIILFSASFLSTELNNLDSSNKTGRINRINNRRKLCLQSVTFCWASKFVICDGFLFSNLRDCNDDWKCKQALQRNQYKSNFQYAEPYQSFIFSMLLHSLSVRLCSNYSQQFAWSINLDILCLEISSLKRDRCSLIVVHFIPSHKISSWKIPTMWDTWKRPREM